jgi:hypothetical protein
VGRGSILLGLGTFFGGKGFMLWAKELDSFEGVVYFLEGIRFFWEGLDSCGKGIDFSWAWDIFWGLRAVCFGRRSSILLMRGSICWKGLDLFGEGLDSCGEGIGFSWT